MGLDTVEIVIDLEQAFNIEIKDKEAEQLCTTGDIINFICQKLKVSDTASGPCLSARAFYQLRQSVLVTTNIPRCGIRPNTRLRSHFSGPEGRARWTSVGQHMGFKKFPGLSFLGIPSRTSTFGRMADRLVAENPRHFITLDSPWTRTQVRQVVRAIVGRQVGTTDFPDDAHLVKELGLD